MTKRSEQALPVPEELFHALAAMINRLIYIAEEECGLDPIQLLILWHIRHFGRINQENDTVILRQELTRMLKRKFRYTDGGVSKLLSELQDQGYVVRAAVSTRERSELFGGHGDTRVVILKHGGNQKIDYFKHRLRSRAEKWLALQTPATKVAVRTFQPIVEHFARWLVRRYEPEHGALLYPPDEGR
jgi:DNA-binding MarR family transcriptional regulator